MAVTALWRVKGYIGKVLLYAENPDKTSVPKEISVVSGLNRNSLEDVIVYAGREEATNQRQLVSGINCTPDKAREEMMAVKRQYLKTEGTIAYHGYQSFKEDEVTPEDAHQIARELAAELWGDRYQILIATHVDKESHIHSHFVINTVSFVDGKKFYRSKQDYLHMREVSDRLCREHGLSVIERPKGKGKNYSEWSAEKNGKPTNRGLIRADIDKAIAASVTERDFFELLDSWGYEFKFYSKSGQELQRPSLRPRGAERFYRFDRLGEDYTLEEIQARILENVVERIPFIEEEEEAYQRYRKEYPPATELRGVSAIFYHYSYELHLIQRFPHSLQSLTSGIREDLKKLERLDDQTVLLASNGIETIDDLNEFRTNKAIEIEELKSLRDELRNKLKRVVRSGEDDAVLEVKKNIAGITQRIEKVRSELKTCDQIESRSKQVQERLASLRKSQTEGKGNADELFKRRSGTDRKDVT